jgi:hypothetical protein
MTSYQFPYRVIIIHFGLFLTNYKLNRSENRPEVVSAASWRHRPNLTSPSGIDDYQFLVNNTIGNFNYTGRRDPLAYLDEHRHPW